MLAGSVVRLHEASDEWTAAMRAADGVTTGAEHARSSCLASLASYGDRRSGAIANADESVALTDSKVVQELQLTEAGLVPLESEVAADASALEAIVRDKMRASSEVSDLNDEVQRWKSVAEEAEQRDLKRAAESMCALAATIAADGTKADSEDRSQLRAHECWQRYREAADARDAAQAKVDDLHRRLIETSERHGARRAERLARSQRAEELTVEAGVARRRHSAVLCQWSEVLEAEEMCGVQLRGFVHRLADSQGSLKTERAQRDRLQLVVRELAASLAALDDHLESLKGFNSENGN
eukprot:gnl/TRDRNA2_/TRDRNA2_83925_c0_seq1.p1 gnl/TRDRNA2_/TRDRNA2_83925_c0~~gnl/TRDRNA2_/TRDRNA2_83925_c0_seq1.p1  ORF type:complete len:297 (-),score=71.13 gnl/TRDRNA2_/TRDRNA2_83925_c0_seq1:44-934(-)